MKYYYKHTKHAVIEPCPFRSYIIGSGGCQGNCEHFVRIDCYNEPCWIECELFNEKYKNMTYKNELDGKSYQELRNKIIGVLDNYEQGLLQAEPEKKELKTEDFVDNSKLIAMICADSLKPYNMYSNGISCDEDNEKLKLYLCLLRIARECNGDWRVGNNQDKYHLSFNENIDEFHPSLEVKGFIDINKVYFKSEADAQLALDYITKNFDLDKIKG